MRHHLLLAPLAVLTFGAAAPAVEPADLKPGLVATHHDTPTGKPTVTRLEPTAAVVLGRGESTHPRLKNSGFMLWQGYVNVVRPGKYRFDATVRGGQVQVKVNNAPVLAGTADSTPATALRGREVALEGGVQPIEVIFLRGPADAAARVEVFWEGPGFVREPLNGRYLGHVPDQRPESFAGDVRAEHGRFLFEELACAKCHKPSDTDAMARTLADRAGPNLTEVARRAYPGWIDAWLADPAKHRPHTAMPKVFGDDERGRAERYAVTRYLMSLAAGPLAPYRPPTVPPGDVRQSTERGRVLYTVTGCAACHQEPKPRAKGEEDEREPLKPEDHLYSLGTAGPAGKYALGALGSKTRPEVLAAYLQDPLKTNPAGRMPHMVLNPQEALDIARYLCRVTDEGVSAGMPDAPRTRALDLGRDVFRDLLGAKARDELVAFRKLPEEKQWAAVGEKLMALKGCVDCHAVEPGGKRLAPVDRFARLDEVKAAGAGGCLGDNPDPAYVPAYKLSADERAALAAFLRTGLSGAGAPAPAHAAHTALRRFNCLNCHGRDGEGGIANDLADQMRLLEKAENADDVRPPLLTGIGHKARASWLKSVLTDRGRARPWMQLRMPQYGEANVGRLPEALAHLEGAVPDDSIRKLPLVPATIDTGRQIVGKGGLGCISCHDIGTVANTGTRGPDLATINQRVRYEWYERWMHQPLRVAPGTRMPQAFVDGKSTLSTVLGGDPKLQAEAMWTYLSLGPKLPLPEGLEPPKGLIVQVRERPEVLRTFMPDAGAKAVAVGYPGGVNLAFSADQCRLAYAWGGNFLDASPVWNNRGGAPARLLGPRFWTAPPAHPWGLTTNPRIPPDFLARANNPAFGTPLPLEPARIHDGPMAVHFDGYSLDKAGRPTFRYSLDEGGTGAVLKVAETFAPVKASAATGLGRAFAVEAPAGYTAWLLAGQSSKDPRVLLTADGSLPALDLKADEPLAGAAGTRVVLPQDADAAVVLEAVGAPAGTAWRFVPRSGGGWLAVLRLPESKGGWKGEFTLVLWALPKDDEALLRGLTAK
jgi:mono/diheme cytochrome c family protein